MLLTNNQTDRCQKQPPFAKVTTVLSLLMVAPNYLIFINECILVNVHPCKTDNIHIVAAFENTTVISAQLKFTGLTANPDHDKEGKKEKNRKWSREEKKIMNI